MPGQQKEWWTSLILLTLCVRPQIMKDPIVTSGEFETLIFQKERWTLPMTFPLYCLLVSRSDRMMLELFVCVWVCVWKPSNEYTDNSVSFPRATHSMVQWNLPAWEQTDGDSDGREGWRERARDKSLRLRKQLTHFEIMSVYLKWLEGWIRTRLWVEGKHQCQEGMLVFPQKWPHCFDSFD